MLPAGTCSYNTQMGSMSIPSEKQGQLGDLTKKTLQELRELLDRQDKLLKKEKFLQTLPDKGVKVKTFAQTLRTLIAQREDIERAAATLEGVTISGHGDKQTSNRHRDKKVTAIETNQERKVQQEGDNSKNEAAVCEASVTRNDTELRGDKSIAMDVSDRLSEVLERVTISTDHRVSVGEDAYINSYERVIKKANEQIPLKKAFKPNSTLKISKVEDLPEVYKFRSKQDRLKVSQSSGVSGGSERKTESSVDSSKSQPKDESAVVLPDYRHDKSVSRPKDESAVVLPDYKHDKSVLISVEESLQLVSQQRKHHGELMMRQATERLAGRLHIRLDDYNPEGTNMDYRVPASDTDSDDEPEMGGYNDD
ncbi:DNA-directed RNA polymerase II subunit GRINL1A-like isoform X2 [Haliotis cracherodii]|uniref:DNA-directed RNA polymerase II subunit GRINL1A-like isoform X2 n=1 Tax=Haliotis cracherodii TaxID=6455 RepID=UPI0039E897A5